MFEGLTSIGLKPVLAGCVLLLVMGIAGWGIAGETSSWPIRAVRCWVEWVAGCLLRSTSWFFRTILILANNLVACALMVLVGAVPGGGWLIVSVVGLTMGVALRTLSLRLPDVDQSDQMPTSGRGALLAGLVMNLAEVPAIAISLGLCMGQQAAPNGLPMGEVWSIFVGWVVPALVIAACGESLLLGRLKVQPSH